MLARSTLCCLALLLAAGQAAAALAPNYQRARELNAVINAVAAAVPKHRSTRSSARGATAMRWLPANALLSPRSSTCRQNLAWSARASSRWCSTSRIAIEAGARTIRIAYGQRVESTQVSMNDLEPPAPADGETRRLARCHGLVAIGLQQLTVR